MREFPAYEVAEPVKIKSFYSFFEQDYKNGYRFSGEMHNFWECVYVEQGQICAIADENVYDLSAGEMIVHKPLEFHGFFVPCEEGARVCIWSFAMEGDLDDALMDKVFRLGEEQKQAVRAMYTFLKQQYAQVFCKKMELFPGIQAQKLFEEKPQCLAYVAAGLCQLLLSLTEGEAKRHRSGAADADVFHRAVDYMNTFVDQPLAVEQIAREVSVSTSSLNRVFHKYAQVAVHKYFLLLKIKTATQLLQSGVNVNETYRRLGFSNQSYFSTCYKRETGQNPSEILRK